MTDEVDPIEYPPGVVEPLDALAIELRRDDLAITLYTVSDQIDIGLEQLRWLVEVGGPEALRKLRGGPGDELTVDLIYENPDAAFNTIRGLQAEVQRLTRERDLAIAHDTQPYPTAAAYERVCAALNEHKRRMETALEQVRRGAYISAAATLEFLPDDK